MPTARISERTHEFLRRQSEKTGESIPVVLERLLIRELGDLEIESNLRGEVSEVQGWQKKVDRALVSIAKRLDKIEGREGRDVSEDGKENEKKKGGFLAWLDSFSLYEDEDGDKEKKADEEKDDGWF